MPKKSRFQSFLTGSMPFYTIFLWPDAAEASKRRQEYWFDWSWNDQDRIITARPNDDEWNLSVFRNWHNNGFIPMAVWLDRPTRFWETLARECHSGPVGLYLMANEPLDTHLLLCDPDWEVLCYWEYLCRRRYKEECQIPFGGPQEQSFRDVYAEILHDWMKRSWCDDFKLDVDTPRRSLSADEFRRSETDSNLFELVSFSFARLRLQGDTVVPEGAFRVLPKLAVGRGRKSTAAAWASKLQSL